MLFTYIFWQTADVLDSFEAFFFRFVHHKDFFALVSAETLLDHDNDFISSGAARALGESIRERRQSGALCETPVARAASAATDRRRREIRKPRDSTSASQRECRGFARASTATRDPWRRRRVNRERKRSDEKRTLFRANRWPMSVDSSSQTPLSATKRRL